jgi:diadenosine tetraphosphate (Ap4A) HIT family hydrolase
MNDTILGILRENPLFADDFFHIVKDKEPLCSDHYIVLPKIKCSSLADLDLTRRSHLEELLSREKPFKEYGFFERGNANFCSSINAPPHAHAHLVPLRYFETAVTARMLQGCERVVVDCLSDGLALANKGTEYLFVGRLGFEWSFVSPFVSPTKRYIRSVLTENLTR